MSFHSYNSIQPNFYLTSLNTLRFVKKKNVLALEVLTLILFGIKTGKKIRGLCMTALQVTVEIGLGKKAELVKS